MHQTNTKLRNKYKYNEISYFYLFTKTKFSQASIFFVNVGSLSFYFCKIFPSFHCCFCIFKRNEI